MSSDLDIVKLVEVAFASVAKPTHFGNHRHCEECAEYDAILTSEDRSTLKLEQVDNPAADPLCFSSPHGKAYYMPSLVRFALQEANYWPRLVFHLESNGPNNDLICYCNSGQRAAVAAFLEHLVETRTQEVDQSGHLEEVLRTHGYWSSAA
jgi:hypothetical protein